MLKKKIVILIIVLVVLAGLVSFFWPKVSYFYGGSTTLKYIKECECLGWKGRGKNYPPKILVAEGALVSYCYGIVYNCVNK